MLASIVLTILHGLCQVVMSIMQLLSPQLGPLLAAHLGHRILEELRLVVARSNSSTLLLQNDSRTGCIPLAALMNCTQYAVMKIPKITRRKG